MTRVIFRLNCVLESQLVGLLLSLSVETMQVEYLLILGKREGLVGLVILRGLLPWSLLNKFEWFFLFLLDCSRRSGGESLVDGILMRKDRRHTDLVGVVAKLPLVNALNLTSDNSGLLP